MTVAGDRQLAARQLARTIVVESSRALIGYQQRIVDLRLVAVDLDRGPPVVAPTATTRCRISEPASETVSPLRPTMVESCTTPGPSNTTAKSSVAPVVGTETVELRSCRQSPVRPIRDKDRGVGRHGDVFESSP